MAGNAGAGPIGAGTAAALSALYASFAAAWIVLSDRLLSYFVSEPQRLTAWQTYKGWLFVAVTALLLYAALRARRDGERGQAAPAGGITRLALRYEVAFVLVALVVPLATLVGIYVAATMRQAEDFATARMRTVVADVGEDVAAALRDSELRMTRLASRELVRALDPKRCDPALADLRSLHPEYAVLELRDSNGRLVCGDPSRAAHATASVAEFPWFAQALRRGGFNASEAFFGVVAKKWVSLQTYPVAGENGTGLLVLPLDLESLRSHAQDLDLSAGTNVAIIDRDGTFLMNLREPQRVGRNYRGASSVSAVLGRVSGTGRFEGMDGVERFYSWSELPQAGWHVYAGTPVRELFAPVREFALYGALVIVVVLLLVVTLARLIARRIVEPVEAIGAAARRIAAGDSAARAPLAGAPELVAVAAQFNAMIDRRLASEARFEQLVGIASDYVWELDAQFRFSFLSPSIEQRSAVPYREYLGKRFPELPFLRLPQADWEALLGCLEAHEPLRNFELGLTNAAGEQRWFVVSADPLFAADGRFDGYRGVGHDITEARRAEEALLASEQRYRGLSRRLLNVQEEERRALARELHDEFGQALTALKLNLSALRRESADARAGALLKDSLDLTDQTIARIRARSLDLRPAMLDDLGLAATVQWYAQQQSMRSGIPVVASVGPLAERPGAGVETAVFRIVQEALTNALRHARASRVDIRAWWEDGQVCVSVRDDGCGFDPQRLPAGSGSGLTGMAERVRALDGEIRLISAPGQGTEVRACVPTCARSG